KRAAHLVDRHAIVKNLDATTDRIILNARSTDIQSRLIIAAEELLNDDARLEIQHPGQGSLAALLLFGIDQIGRARHVIEPTLQLPLFMHRFVTGFHRHRIQAVGLARQSGGGDKQATRLTTPDHRSPSHGEQDGSVRPGRTWPWPTPRSVPYG